MHPKGNPVPEIEIKNARLWYKRFEMIGLFNFFFYFLNCHFSMFSRKFLPLIFCVIFSQFLEKEFK